MKILECELVGYQRMALGASNYFLFKPTEVLQLVLGTNGSGKSSLMRELFPFPADSADFTREGFKRVRYEHLGKEYEVRSGFSPTKHSFQVNEAGKWVELNEGGTQRVQVDLIKTHFGITAEIRDLLLNEIQFHSMSPMVRRQFFTLMSDADYTFGLRLFNLARERVRDFSGAIKFNRTRIAAESAKIISDEEREQLQRQTNQLHKELNVLLAERSPSTKSSEHFRTQKDELLAKGDRLSERIFQTELKRPHGCTLETEAEITDTITQLGQAIHTMDHQIQERTRYHSELSRDIETLKQTGGQGLAELQAKRQALLTQSKALSAQLSHPWDHTLYPQMHDAFRALENELDTLFTALPENENKYYSNQTLTQLRTEREQHVLSLEKYRTQARKVQAEIEHQASHEHQKATVCPQCAHSWVVGFNATKLEQLKAHAVTLIQQERELNAQIAKLDERIGLVLEFFEQYRTYSRIKSGYPILSGLWERLDQENLAFTYPREALRILNQLRADIPLLAQLFEHHEEIKHLDLLSAALAQTDQKNLSSATERLAKLEREVGELTQQRAQARERREQYQSLAAQLKELQALSGRLTEILHAANQAHGQEIAELRNEILNATIRQLQSRLAITEEKLSYAELQRGVVEQLKASTEQAMLDEQAAKIIMQELSPTEGLIAEGLMGFINAFTKQMNNVIASIWSYPLEILPCSFHEERGVELDYRFPMRVADRAKPIADINRGSRGMKEITDLAFKIVAMKYLGLSDIPLFLDEFGSGLDEHHRGSSMHAIRQIVEQMEFRQVFIVSHYEASYGGLANMEICVLCDKNIKVPDGANRHVEKR